MPTLDQVLIAEGAGNVLAETIQRYVMTAVWLSLRLVSKRCKDAIDNKIMYHIRIHGPSLTDEKKVTDEEIIWLLQRSHQKLRTLSLWSLSQITRECVNRSSWERKRVQQPNLGLLSIIGCNMRPNASTVRELETDDTHFVCEGSSSDQPQPHVCKLEERFVCSKMCDPIGRHVRQRFCAECGLGVVGNACDRCKKLFCKSARCTVDSFCAEGDCQKAICAGCKRECPVCDRTFCLDCEHEPNDFLRCAKENKCQYCDRPPAPGWWRPYKPYTTCCQPCALRNRCGFAGHDEECDARGAAGLEGEGHEDGLSSPDSAENTASWSSSTPGSTLGY
jgi:hypothetical protein